MVAWIWTAASLRPMRGQCHATLTPGRLSKRIRALAAQKRTGTVCAIYPHEAPRGAAADAVPFNPSVSS